MANSRRFFLDFSDRVMDEVVDGLRKVVEEKGSSTDVAKQLKNAWTHKYRGQTKNSHAKSQPKTAGAQMDSSANLAGGNGSVDDSNVADCSKNSSNDDVFGRGDYISDTTEQALLDVEPTVVCQLDSIRRSGNAWNLQLRDGILRVDGKDIPFQRATGDATW